MDKTNELIPRNERPSVVDCDASKRKAEENPTNIIWKLSEKLR